MRAYSVVIPNTAYTNIGGAITIAQVVAGASRSIRVISIWLTQSNLTTNTQQRIRVLRKSAAATVTALTPAPLVANDAAATATAGHNATVEGTDSTVLYDASFGLMVGWYYKPAPEEFIEVPGSGIIALKLGAAPAATTNFEGEITFQEMG